MSISSKGSAKILVLGDSGVGKSSLIHLICRSTVLSAAQWTIGCSIDVKLHDNYFLEFWDIGGSRSHKIARSFLYQDYHGIILVFDATNNKSRLNLNDWLKEVTHKNNDFENFVNLNVPIITISTKKDLLPHGSILDESSAYYSNEHSSVVNFNENIQTSHPHRRYQSSTFSNSSEPLLVNQVIYVNTQDVLSFSNGSKNYEDLNIFLRQVINRRNSNRL